MHLRAILFLLPIIVSFSGYSSLLESIEIRGSHATLCIDPKDPTNVTSTAQIYFPKTLEEKFFEVFNNEVAEKILLKYNKMGEKHPLYPQANSISDAFNAVTNILGGIIPEAISLIKTSRARLEYPLPSNIIYDDKNFNIQDPLEVLALLKTIPTGDFHGNSRKVNKARKHLYKATKRFTELKKLLNEAQTILEEAFPGYSNDQYLKTVRVLLALMEWKNHACKTQSHKELNKEFFSNQFVASLLQTGYLNLIQYICPHVDYEKLTSEPETYYQTCIEGSLLQMQMPSLRTLIEKHLAPTGVPVCITALIGDHDDQIYLFPYTNPTMKLDQEKLEKRHEEFTLAVQDYFSSNLPSIKVHVHSISKNLKSTCGPRDGNEQTTGTRDLFSAVHEEVQKNLDNYIGQDDFNLEIERMRTLFEKGSYYSSLRCDELEKILPTIVRAKFTSYAIDGLIGSWLAIAPQFSHRVKQLIYSLMKLNFVPDMEAVRDCLESVRAGEHFPLEIFNLIKNKCMPEVMTPFQIKNLLDSLLRVGVLSSRSKEIIEKNLIEKEEKDLPSKEVLDLIVTHLIPSLPFLIQTESPGYLRTKMLSALVDMFYGIKFPTVYPFENSKDKLSVMSQSPSLSKNSIPYSLRTFLPLSPKTAFTGHQTF